MGITRNHRRVGLSGATAIIVLLLTRNAPATSSAPVAPLPAPVPFAQLIVDGGFETGGIPNTFWNPETSTNFGTPLCDVPSCGTGGGASPPRTGAFWAWFGGIPAPETATLGQTVNIPVGVASLTFWLRIGTVSSPFTDVLNVRVDGAIVASFPEPTVAEGAYTLRTVDVSAFANGAAHAILFEYIGPTSGTGSYVVDDVELNPGVENGNFSAGIANWTPYATSTVGVQDNSFIVHNSGAGGVFEFYRKPPTADGNEAQIFQNTTLNVPDDSPLSAQFDLGNTSTLRKRINVLIFESDFSDISACTFWLDPGSPSGPMQTYRMRTHTTKEWFNASIAFYAGSVNQPGDTSVFRIDNVSMNHAPGGSVIQVECEDPTRPTIVGGLTSISLTSGFGAANPSGVNAPWVQFGQIDAHVAAGAVLEIQKLPVASGQQYGVVFEQVATNVLNDQRVAATFDLGNSSGVRQRLKVVIGSKDFGDFSACSFYLEPGALLTAHGMRSFATQTAAVGAPGNLTISFYATNPTSTWLQVRNVQMVLTQTLTIGTECFGPGSIPAFVPDIIDGSGGGLPRLVPGSRSFDARDGRWTPSSGFGLESALSGAGPAWRAVATATETSTLRWGAPIDLRQASSAALSFTSALSPGKSGGDVQVSLDGATWNTVLHVPATPGATSLEINLSAFAGEIIYVRFVYRAVAPGERSAPDDWQLSDVRIDTSGLAPAPSARDLLLGARRPRR